MEFDFNTVMDMKYLRRLKRLLGASDRISLRLRNLAVSSFVLGTCSRWKARFKVFSGVFRITHESYISVLINFSKTRSSATRLLRNICVNDEKKNVLVKTLSAVDMRLKAANEKNNFKYKLLWGEFLFHAKMSKFEGEKKFQSKTFEESSRKKEDETRV